MSSRMDFSQVPEFPPYFQVETVALCNARCIMCLTGRVERENAIMPNGLFEKIVHELELYAAQIKRVTLHGLGEPLCDHDLENRIRCLKAAKIQDVVIATNGSLMTDARAKTILGSGVDEVTFSVDGATRPTYETIRIGLRFDSVMRNIEQFIACRDRNHPSTRIRIRWTAQQANQEELSLFYQYWQSRLGPQDSAYAKWIHIWAGMESEREQPNHYDRESLDRKPCSSLWTSLYIYSDGRVPICCNDCNAALRVGDVRQQTLRDIWHSSRMNYFRQQHLGSGRQSLKLCRNCVVWDEEATIPPSVILPESSS